MSTHFILDLETLDTAPTAHILSVGLVRADIEHGRVVRSESIYERVESVQHNRTTSPSTAKWWAEQSQAARAEAFQWAHRSSLEHVVQKVIALLAAYPSAPIWGCGSDFDNVILADACRQFGREWPGKRNRCLRTFRSLIAEFCPAFVLPGFPTGMTPHHALHDAMHEAIQLGAMLAEMERMSASAN